MLSCFFSSCFKPSSPPADVDFSLLFHLYIRRPSANNLHSSRNIFIYEIYSRSVVVDVFFFTPAPCPAPVAVTFSGTIRISFTYYFEFARALFSLRFSRVADRWWKENYINNRDYGIRMAEWNGEEGRKKTKKVGISSRDREREREKIRKWWKKGKKTKK